MTTFLCNLYLQIWELTQHKNTNLRSVMVRKYECNFCMANIRLHKKLCKKGNKSTLCLPVQLVAAIKITGAECFCKILSSARSHRWSLNIRKLKIFGQNEKYNSLNSSLLARRKPSKATTVDLIVAIKSRVAGRALFLTNWPLI